MAESIDPGTVFPVYPICVYSGICRSEIHIYTDRCRREGFHDLICDSTGCDLYLHDPVRKILLGFACAFGTLGDGVHALYVWICKKDKKKPLQIADAWTEKLCYLKYIVLALISILCFAGVYSEAKGTSPWDVFSMLHAGNFKLGGYLVGLVLLVLIIAGMCFEERFSAEISARWEQFFRCFRSCRFSLFTEIGKTASKDVRHVRRNVLLTSDFRKTDLKGRR